MLPGRVAYHDSVGRENLRKHLVDNAIRTDGPFRLRSGLVSSWYLDARQTTFSGLGAIAVAEAVLELVSPETEAIGGMTMGADPIAMACAVVSTQRGRPLLAFSIRKEAKQHGTGGRLVGPVRAGTKVCVVEDTTTTGGAIAEAIDAVTDAGLVVTQVLTLVDRSEGRAAAISAERDVPYEALFVVGDLGVGE